MAVLIDAYHRMRWWPSDSFQEVEPTYSRFHGRLGRLLPVKKKTDYYNHYLKIVYF